MEFKTLTKQNARVYLGKPIVFLLSGKPKLAKLREIREPHFVISSLDKTFLLSVTHPVVVILEKNRNHRPTSVTESVHYPLNFLSAASTTNLLPFVGHHVIVCTDQGKSLSLAKIKAISASLQYLNVENRTCKLVVDIRHTPCYILV